MKKVWLTRLLILFTAHLFSYLSIAEVGNPRLNQVGYLPSAEKIAIYVTDSQKAIEWQLIKDAILIDSGMSMPQGFDVASGDNIHHIDISHIHQKGRHYTLKVGDDTSHPFDIQPNIVSEMQYDALKYFYHNRSGIEIETRYTGGGRGSYGSDSQWARPAGHLNIWPNRGDFDIPCWPGTCDYALDVPYGWYDAGDHGKYVVNGGISVWLLLNIFERAHYHGNNIDAFSDTTLNIPESGNGVPDLLDEVRWQLEFMLAMQVPDAEVLAGMVHHKMHDEAWTGLALAPHEDFRQRYLVPPSTAATLNLAAVAAQCARIWEIYDVAFSNQCLIAAEKAWDAALKNPAIFYNNQFNSGGGPYDDNRVDDEFFWTAVELYITTGKEKYISYLEYDTFPNNYYWANMEIPALMSLATVPSLHTTSYRKNAEHVLISIADERLGILSEQGYRVPITEFEYFWGSNSNISNILTIFGIVYDITDDSKYGNAVGTGLNYLLGSNALSVSYVTGHGENASREPHHRFWAAALNAEFPWAPPGVLTGGPNAQLQDPTAAARLSNCVPKPQTCFIDHIDSYSTNEMAINMNATLAWSLAFYADFANETNDTIPPNNAPIAMFDYRDEGGPQAYFDARPSFDIDGEIVEYRWEFSDGGVEFGIEIQYEFRGEAPFSARLIVTDNEGAAAEQEQALSLVAPRDGFECTLDQNQIHIWATGFVINNIKITNTGQQPSSNWAIQIPVNTDITLGTFWGANVAVENQILSINDTLPRNIAPGNSITVGILGNHNGDFNAPTDCWSLSAP